MNTPKLGPRGGRIISPSAHEPPPELQRQVQRENSIHQSESIRPAIEVENERNLELEAMKALVDGYAGVILRPKKIEDGKEVLLHEIINVHMQQRGSVEISRGLRSDCVAIACTKPFFRLAGYETETFEVLLPQFIPLVELLRDFEAENGMSLEPLRELCACDEGRCHEERPEPEKQPTIQDLISGLTNALKGNQKPV